MEIESRSSRQTRDNKNKNTQQKNTHEKTQQKKAPASPKTAKMHMSQLSSMPKSNNKTTTKKKE